ncbi:hypothetical protein GCM10010301_57970 [Streptomyces plicatus]|nr:hypothetical protein GCM10010301_57970 [Streptomyces plicatus]
MPGRPPAARDDAPPRAGRRPRRDIRSPEPRALARPRPGPRGDVPTAADRLPAVLAAVDQEHPALCLTDIGRRAGLSLTTAHRLVGGR